MTTIAQSIRLEPELLSVYDQLAEATGRSRNQLFVEALRRFAATEGWQIQQVRATLARLEAGTLAIVPGEQVVADLLARGRITQEALSSASRSSANVDHYMLSGVRRPQIGWPASAPSEMTKGPMFR